ncbi:uncharacterized protein BO87DRAFT_401752 [Aspergillus neoniger CBS 115656]|uniref:Uncharacterized protein n=1 Tax=Aspergillus neoniger (strain CBS 115656) TaxID=1448310 RepID=A0A318Y570_ASPNB|nr:hypothetical protein BO87DRAFT_401752 [Aspergillus neoniger CBS 115656]PYH28954.1 hypothetical protein BO87DRAFT_401752 [Aspergillus neoniger CBS 115656]
MAAIDLLALEARHQVIKRSNWAGENPGVVLVFCIVFIVAVGIIALFIYRKCMARKAAKQSYERYDFGLATSLQRSICTFSLSLCAFCPSVKDTRSCFWWIWALTDCVDLMDCLYYYERAATAWMGHIRMGPAVAPMMGLQVVLMATDLVFGLIVISTE